jgi:predicted alpha/beta-hydrolase family hydrolase
MLAASQSGFVDGLLLLSYPLHPPKRADQLRTDHFSELRTNALFVHGTRDGFGTVQELTEALTLIPAHTELLTVAGAGHELLTSRNRETLPKVVVESFLDFARPREHE